MFGTFRFVLALMVVWYHTVDREMAGRVAVFGFYCLSGYLMTRVINTTYADGIGGFGRYLANRALRIYPTYLAVVALTMAAIGFWPSTVGTRFHPDMFDGDVLLANLTLARIDDTRPLFVGASWSLTVEIIHYIAIGVLLGRSRLATGLWFVFGLEIAVIGTIFDYPPSWLYFSPVGSTVAFASGAMIWHFRNWLPRSNGAVGTTSIGLVLLCGLVMPRGIGTSGGLYIGLTLAAACVIYLSDLPASSLDRRLGEFSYPLFLIHMPVDQIVRGVANDDQVQMIVFTLPITFALAWLAIMLIDRPVERLRGSLRRRTSRSTTQLPVHARQQKVSSCGPHIGETRPTRCCRKT